jgi:nicotinamidase-related amidase
MTDSPAAIDPRRAALLVMDFQTAILEHLPESDGLLTRVAETIRTARAQGVLVGYVRAAFSDADLAAIPGTNKAFALLAARPGFLREDAPETAIHERVAPKPGDIVVRKIRVGAFSTTDLDAQLGHRGIDTLILAGVSTSGVVLSTVRDAADRDYRIFVLSDGCADSDPELHDVLTRKVLVRQAHVITTAELPGLIQAR